MSKYDFKKIEGDTIIVDIDGTIADANHRLHYIKIKPKNWKAFIEASQYDEPFHDVVWLVKLIKTSGVKVVIVTARSEHERNITINWLHNVAKLEGVYEKLYMRSDDDYRRDDIVKQEILEQIRDDGYDPFMALEDRDHVVDMWRANGLRCLQVNKEDK